MSGAFPVRTRIVSCCARWSSGTRRRASRGRVSAGSSTSRCTPASIPKTAEWASIFDTAYAAPVDYTHVPGREWIVRDYQLGKHLMQIDGKIAPGDRWAGLQQGRGSLSTGYLRGGHERVEFGRRYSKSLAAFLDSMVVAEGTDHQRLRKAFLPFFTQTAVLSQAQFVEQTVAELLDHASSVARRNGGAFDLRNDFAYRFPVRVICRVLELPAEDVPSVQHWAEASVRSMDTEAGPEPRRFARGTASGRRAARVPRAETRARAIG